MSKRLILSIIFTVGVISTIYAETFFPYKSNPSDIRVVPVKRTPESETVKIKITFPEPSEIKMKEPVRIQLNTDGFPLGTNSEFPRKKEVWNDPEGQAIHIVVDNHSYFSVNYANVKSLDSRENFYTEITELSLPFKLTPGEHVIRAFAVRSYNESLKDSGAFTVERFFFQSRENRIDQNLKAPYITYNEPIGTYDNNPEEPILLDFYVTNTQLSKDGYKVELSIDGTVMRILTVWSPYYLYGLPEGKHTIRLRLLDPQNKVSKGVFNDIKKTIIVK